LPTDDESQQLDYLTRCTYNLLWAAAEESVPHAIFLSTLHLLTHYEENLWVQEHWRPRPTAEPHTLGKLLGESVCREFAREHKLRITVLRLGEVVRADEVAGEPFSPLWVDERDVAHAVACVLATDTGVWSIFHIQPDSPQARYVINNAKEHLDYEPQFNFDEIKAPPSHPLTSR
jgi:nucleoside-diphosphate-sugar epimerase